MVKAKGLSLRGAKRRGALSAQREEVPLGCNLAGPGWITGHSRRKRNCLPEIATAPLGPRNDNSGAFAILTAAYTGRKCVAGRGQPGPYNAWPKARELFILHFSVFSIHLFLRAPPLQRTSGSLVKFYTTKYPPFPDTDCRFRRYIPFFRRDYRRGGGQNRTPFSPRPPA